MNNTVPANFYREMGLTTGEFLRTLPAAIAPLTYRVDDGAITIMHPSGSILIDLHRTGERRIASMRLPVTRVDFRFDGLNAAERKAFLARLDLYFHRGGG